MFLRARGYVLAAIAAALAPLALMADSVFDAIPADAKIVIVANNLKAADDHVKSFIDAVGVPLPPGMDLNMLTMASGLGELWDTSRSAAFVIIDPFEEKFAIVLPVTDGAGAMKKLGGKEGGDVSRVTFPPGEQSSAMVKGDLLFVAKDDAGLEAFKSVTNALGGSAKKAAEGADFFAFVNVKAFRPMALQGLEAVGPQLENLPAQPGMDPQLMTDLAKMFLDSASKFLEQTDGLYVALSISGDKVGVRFDLVFVGDSYLANHLGKLKSGGNILADLPAGTNFMFAGGMNSPELQQLIVDSSQAFLGIPSVRKSIPEGQADKSIASLKDMYSLMSGFSFSVGTTDKGMTGFGEYFSKDHEALRAKVGESADAMAAMMKMSPGMSGKVEPKKVGDLEVLEMTFDYSGMPEDQKKMITAMYGETMVSQMALVNGKFRFAMGQDDPIKNWQSPGGKFTELAGVKKILSDLPAEAPALMFIDLFGYAKAITRMLSAMPFPFPIPEITTPQPPPPPVGIAVTGADGTMTTQVVVKAETVKEVVKAVHAAMNPK